MSELQITLPNLHKGQKQAFDSPARFKILACGRRWGKTRLACVMAVTCALEGGRVWWIGPTYPMASIGWRMLKRLTLPLQPDKSETERSLSLPSGGEIWVKSADNPDSLRGEGLDLAIFDECAFIREAAWVDSIRPALTDREGDAVFISTPKGRNWFWRLWNHAKEENDWEAWHYKSAGNPHLEEREIEAAREELPDSTFKQEYLAEFLENEGAVFRNIEANPWTPKQEQIVEHIGHRTVVGVDWGKHQDFTTISVVCTECMCEIEKDRFNKIDYTFQRDRLKRLVDKWKPVRVLAEQNAMEANLEMLQREGVRVIGWTMTSPNKPGLITSPAVSLEKEEVRWLDDPIWTAELEAFEQQVNKNTGRSSYSAPQGLHDDTVIARALAREAVAMSHRRSIYI